MRFEGRTAAKKPGALICGKWKVERVVRVTEQLASYEAKDPSGARVYVKVIHPYKADDAPLVARLKREAYVANRIKHPSMVRVLGDGVTDEGSVAIALELVEGETLEELRTKRGGLLPPEEVAKLGLALCDALQAAHDERVIHRDVRPDSFMMTKKGEVRVPEFAAARVMGEEVEARERTAAGTTLGSPAFMAPEQARGQRDRVDARSDVFGLGATLYTLVSGKTVHPADNPLAALLAASRERAKPVRTVMRTPIPDYLADAIDKALKFEPVDRFPTMRAFKKALEAGAPKPAAAPIARTQQSVAPPPKADPLAARPSQMPPPPLAGRAPMGSSPLLGRPPTAQPFAPSPPAHTSQGPSRPAPPQELAHPTAVGPQVPKAPPVPSFAPPAQAPEPPRERMAKPELPRVEMGDEVTALMPLPGPHTAPQEAYGPSGAHATSPRASTAASPAYGPPGGHAAPAMGQHLQGDMGQPGMGPGPMGHPSAMRPHPGMAQPAPHMGHGGHMGHPQGPGMSPGMGMGHPNMGPGPQGQHPGMGPQHQAQHQGQQHPNPYQGQHQGQHPGPYQGQPHPQHPMGMGQPMGQHPGQPMMGMGQHQGPHMGQPPMGMAPAGMGPHPGMGHAGASGGYGALVPGQPAPKPDRTLAFVAAGGGVVLILCALLYAFVFLKGG